MTAVADSEVNGRNVLEGGSGDDELTAHIVAENFLYSRDSAASPQPTN
jgi:hypothetical protein